MMCFHGTTKSVADKILSGSLLKEPSVWSCSEEDFHFYVWPEDKLINEYDLGDYDSEEKFNRCVDIAFESAQLTGALNEECELVVLLFDIPDEYLNDDTSDNGWVDLPSMYKKASYIELDEFDVSWIIDIYQYDMNKWLIPFVLCRLLGNPMFNKSKIGLMLLHIVEILSKKDNYEVLDYLIDFSEKRSIKSEYKSWFKSWGIECE